MKRPYITLKLATSLDGKIALANGQSEWITCEASRAAGRRLRATHDAIAVGANTAVLDNPQLTARIAGQPDPVRVIFDSGLRLLPDSNLALTAKANPVWVFCKSDTVGNGPALSGAGVTLLPVNHENGLDIAEALEVLHRRDIKSLLLEGGGTLAASFIKLGVIDVIEWFRAPIVLGGDGRSGIGSLGLEKLDLAKRFERISVSEVGDDMHERYEAL